MKASRTPPAVPPTQQRGDYVTSLASAVWRLGQHQSVEDLVADVTAGLFSGFDASRAELWLWDDGGNSGYLTDEAGAEIAHRHDYLLINEGPIGTSVASREAVFNQSVDLLDLVRKSALTHFSAFPLAAHHRVTGVLVAYSSGPASADLLKWWKMYADVAALAAQRVLNATESHRQIQQLSLLFEATRLLNSTLDLAELLDLILRIAKTEVKADRGTVFLADMKRRELWSIVAQGLDSQEIRVPFGKGVAGHVAENGEAINVEDAYTLPFFDQSFDQKFGYRTTSLLCLPIRHHSNEIVGVIQLLNHAGGRFSADDQAFLTKLSGHMAMALENARLHHEALEKQRMERDLTVARQIQRSLIPETPPTLHGYDIAVTYEPCFECGGDYYDFLSLGPQTMLVVIADVEGKGVASAMVMSNLQATLRALCMHLHSLEVLMLSLNEMIYNDTKSQKYLSCFVGLIDTRRNGLHYINGGHCPPFLINAADGSFTLLDKGGTVVGLFPDSEYERGTLQMNPGDILVCSTDGITEACNVQEEELGPEGLAALINKYRDLSAQEIVDRVLVEVNEFSKDGPLIDDKVLMVIKVTNGGLWEQATKKS